MSFSGKNIVVTGAGSGIGKAITEDLVRHGARVVAVSLIQDELDLLFQSHPTAVTIVQVDLTDWEATRKALEDVGPVHGLVNCAGIAMIGTFLEIDEDAFDKQFSINVKALINVSQIISKSMISNKINGSIVNISSISSKKVAWRLSLYAASKGAVDSLTRCMSHELGKQGIRVNAVNPTFVKTALSTPYLTDRPQVGKVVQSRIPLRRLAECQDVADVVTFLLSDQSAMVNGVTLPIDGGYSVS